MTEAISAERAPIEMQASAAEEETRSPAEHLKELVKALFQEREYEGIQLLFTNKAEAKRNLSLMPEIAFDLFRDICQPSLTDNNYKHKNALYSCAEELMKLIAAHANAEEFLFELLQFIEEQKSEYVFTTTLRAMQIVLLRMSNDKASVLDWSLKAIINCIDDLPKPKFLSEGYDEQQQKLLEQNKEIQTMLMHYVIIGYFYEPLLKQAVEQSLAEQLVFRDMGKNRRNIMCCFLVNLLGGSFSCLDLTMDKEHKTNSYTIQCATNLTEGATKCIKDPMVLLLALEQRIRWKVNKRSDEQLYELGLKNVYLIEEELPTLGLAIYFYLLLVEKVVPNALPLVYSHFNTFELCLYLCVYLMQQQKPALNYRALLLTDQLLNQLDNAGIPALALEHELYCEFCEALCNVVGYAPQVQIRQLGVNVLRKFIMKFTHEGKYLIITNLMKTVAHNGIKGFLAVVYKDLVVQAMRVLGDAALPAPFSGTQFREIFLQNICQLPNGAETNILDHVDSIMSSLNIIRCFALQDIGNRTGFWDFYAEIEEKFLKPLQVGLNLSIVHFKAELLRVERGLSDAEIGKEQEQLKLLDICINNNDDKQGNVSNNFAMDREHKIKVLRQNLCTFDLICSLLARTNECVDNTKRMFKQKAAQ